MRQLIEFLLRYRVLLTFFLLEFFSIFLVIQNNTFQSAIAFTLMREITGGIYLAYNATTDYAALRTVNDNLAKENAALKELLANNKVRIPLNINSKTDQQYEFITAKVLNNSLIYANNYLTIDKGSNDGVKAGMGVITTNGVVGKVKSCSPNFSIIYSLLHNDIMISSTLKKQAQLVLQNGQTEIILRQVCGMLHDIFKSNTEILLLQVVITLFIPKIISLARCQV